MTIGEKLQTMESELTRLITYLNEHKNYRAAQQFQSLLQTTGGVHEQIKADGVADADFPVE